MDATTATREVDVLIVGAGLSGIGSARHLQRECPERRLEHRGDPRTQGDVRRGDQEQGQVGNQVEDQEEDLEQAEETLEDAETDEAEAEVEEEEISELVKIIGKFNRKP